MYIIEMPKSEESWPSFFGAMLRLTGICLVLIAAMAAIVAGVALLA